jgi:hypothetical protein
MFLRFFAALTATALAVGCGSTGDDIVIDPGSTLVVSPAQAQLEVLNGTPASQPFTVMLVEPGGVARDVTADVDWTISDPAFGTWSGPTFTASGVRAGKGMVHASLQTLVGEAQVEITIRGVRVAADVPSGAPGLFAGATVDPAAAPQVVYPSDQVIVPANLGDLEAHWTDGFGHDLFELTLAGDHVEHRVYVRGGASGWAAFTPAEWESAARSTEQLSIVVRGLTEASPATVGTSPGIRVYHAREDLQGGLYYWAATAAAGQPYGIFRYDFGAVGQQAEEFYTTTQAGRCVACHALSRDGTRMAITYDGGDGPASVVDVATRTATPGGTAWNFATYSPDGERLITSSRGVLTERNGTDATAIATLPLGGWATHPDYSPMGDALVYVQAAAPGADWHFTGGLLNVLPNTGGVWGTPRPLVTDGGNNFYPSFSPDGQWVLFNRSGEDAYDDASAELWVVRADGTAPPRKLDLANVAGGLTNSWARWAPFRNTFQGPNTVAEDMYWITFSSKRAFGVRQPPGKPQIWMAAFFPGRVAIGGDPTGPAFRLPFQDLASNNHIAQWTETVVPIGKMAMPARREDRPQR